MTDPLVFQDEIPDNHCWGCGSRNPYGLPIKSHWLGEEAVCSWQPEEHHAAGPKHILNGGIIATLIDFHFICTAIAAAYRAEGREMNSPPPIWYATASLKVSYLRPAPGQAANPLTPRRASPSCSPSSLRTLLPPRTLNTICLHQNALLRQGALVE